MKLTVYRKMIMGFGLIIVILIGANAYTLLELNSATTATRATLASDIQSMDISKRMRTLLYEGERNAQKYLITRDSAYYDLFMEATGQFQKDLELLAATESGQPEIQVIGRLKLEHERLTRAAIKATTAGGKTIPPDTLQKTRMETIAGLDRSLDRLNRLNQISVGASMAALHDATQRSSEVALGIALLTLLAASMVAWFITRTITRPINRVIQATQQIAKGSFEPIQIPSNDETALLADAVNDMAERLKQMTEFKTNLMHQIIHELRTPLQVISSAQAILTGQQLGDVNEKQLDMLDLIKRNTGSLMNFTNQFLDLAKLDGDMMKFNLAPTDLAFVVARTIEDAEPLASAKGISIVFAPAEAAHVLADGEKLSQVFRNLLSNAIKYAHPSGIVEVTLTCRERRVQVKVRDSGVGIAADDIPKLFTRFYQAANASKGRVAGTGLGLALVKAFVEGHGGKVSVESTPGVGSTFTVELPLLDARENAARSTLAAGMKQTPIHG